MNNRWQARNKHDLTIEVWEYLDCESVGASELEQIQEVIRERFGAGAVESPATIARLLADEGAILRHPEILSCDTRWREARLASSIPMDQLDCSDLRTAARFMHELERQRRESSKTGEDLSSLREQAMELKQYLQLVAASTVTDQGERMRAREIREWITVWLKQPEIFEEWLSLRLTSPDFRSKFPADQEDAISD